MSTDLLGSKTIVITGVGSGLGREIAARLVADGANIAIGARNADQLQAVADEVDPTGERVLAVRTDITDAEACGAIVEAAGERFGRVDGVAQVAAFELVVGGVDEMDHDLARQAFDTNVLGALNVVRAAAGAMRSAEGGSVVLIGSQSMYAPALPQMGYAASKGAMHSAMYYLADELGPEHIRVNTVMPSWMWGPPVQMYVDMQSRARGIEKEEVIDEIVAGIPLGEIVPDEEVANAVSFLLSDRARMITGQTLMVNGGELMR